MLHNTAIWSTLWQFNSKLNMKLRMMGAKIWITYKSLWQNQITHKLLNNNDEEYTLKHSAKKTCISFKLCLFLPLTVKSFPGVNQQDTFNNIVFKSFWKKNKGWIMNCKRITQILKLLFLLLNYFKKRTSILSFGILK